MRVQAFTAIIFAAAAAAQPADKLSFEVATVKLSAGPATSTVNGRTMTSFGTKGGPGTNDPTRWTCTYCDIANLLPRAYGVQSYQLTFPSWMNSEHYDISANVPAGATREQLQIMIRNLLEERFQFKLHRESKDIAGYDLVIGKNGPKLASHVEVAKGVDASPKDDAAIPDDPEARLQKMLDERMAAHGGRGEPMKRDAEGYPVPANPDCKNCMATMNGKATMIANGQTMAELALRLTTMLGKPVSDKTGLKGSYDLTVHFMRDETMGLAGGMPGPAAAMMAARGAMARGSAPSNAASGDSKTPIAGDDPEGGPTLEGALEKQLGLKLQPQKQPLETVVIDRAEKTPIEN